MERSLRSLLIGPAALFIISGLAQPLPPYAVVVSGIVGGCSPSSTTVTITNGLNTLPDVSVTVPVDANCYYSATLSMDSPIGWLLFGTSCLGPGTSVGYTVSSSDTTFVNANLDCLGSTLDCLGVVDGPNVPGTPCDDGNPQTVNDTWAAYCFCMGVEPGGCWTQAQYQQVMDGGEPVPFEWDLVVYSVGAQPITYDWYFGWPWVYVGTTNVPIWQHTFAPGESVAYRVDAVDANGCESQATNVEGAMNCAGIMWSPNWPTLPCTVPGTTIEGTWSLDCECIPYDPSFCEADFWVIQAYGVDTVGNPGGVGEPIPFELWVWNLSSGAPGDADYLWDFGDGTTSTDPFPTHTYANSGPYELCLTMTDAAGCTDTHCEIIEVDEDGFLGFAGDGGARSTLTINVIQELPTGIHEAQNVETMGLWPNPVEDVLNLSLNSTRTGNLDLTILDMNGRVLRTVNRGIRTGSNLVSLSLDGLEAGAYVLRINNGQQAKSQRFVKIR